MFLGIEAGWGQAGVWLLLLIAVWFSGHTLYAAVDFFRRRRPEDEIVPGFAPAVSVLKPLKGEEPALYDNLATFCRQRYPEFQIVFGIADSDDPAVGVVQQLQVDFPEVDITLVIEPTLHGANRKISNLINMLRHAKHPVLAISDGDIRVPEDYLERSVAPLRHQGIGLVTSLYRAVPRGGGLATVLDALFVNTDFCHQVLLARKLEKARYAFGASMVLPRQTLERAGGFERLANLLADDYFLGRFVTDLGLRNWLSECVVETVIDENSLRKLILHQLRWGRTFRSCRPRSYFATIITHGTLWACVNALVGGFAWMALVPSLAIVGLRLATTTVISWRFVRSDLSIGQILLVPLKDLFMSAIWLASFLGETVWWSGRRYRVLPGGEMVPILREEITPAGEAVAKPS
jgi:ceramide glucosyltransferase